MKLYAYWRSSASWRVRIGLALKEIPYTTVPVNLLRGDHVDVPHRERSPLGQVPVLKLADGTQLTQSIAILLWLDSHEPQPALLPANPLDSAQSLALAEVINAGTQPLQNLAVLKAIAALGGDRKAWAHDAIERGLSAFDALAAPRAGTFSVGDSVTIADLTLVPQLYNARRFNVDLERFPRLVAIEERCNALPAFQAAHPDRQVDATP